jgi:hypothetical protein
VAPRPAVTGHARRVVTNREFGFEAKPRGGGRAPLAHAASGGPQRPRPVLVHPASNPSSEFGFEAAP